MNGVVALTTQHRVCSEFIIVIVIVIVIIIIIIVTLR